MAKKNKMQPLTITLPPRHIETLSALVDKTGLHKVELIRRALDDYFEKHEIVNVFNQIFEPSQLQGITAIAKRNNRDEISVLREMVDNEIDKYGGNDGKL